MALDRIQKLECILKNEASNQPNKSAIAESLER
jgi:hypothetical protein